jgi:phosphoglycolate phosphatase-like HAD superfamily hydrolase
VRRLVLFDVDGTLVDSGGAGRAALGRAMVRVFGEAGPIDSCDFHGRTDPSIVRGLLRALGREDAWIDARMGRVWGPYLEILAEELAARNGRAHPYPGVVQLLERLAEEAGVTLGLVTGNLEEGARRKLAAAAVRAPFEVGGYGSDAEHRDELPPVALRRAAERGLRFEPREVWVVGDTPADIRCGRASGLRTLAVATGRHDPGTLREHGADVVFGDLSDVASVAETLLS